MLNLPSGLQWCRFNRLPNGVNVDEFRAFLCERGLDIPTENISVMNYNGKHEDIGSSVMVALPKHVILKLVNWALQGDELRGRKVEASDSKK